MYVVSLFGFKSAVNNPNLVLGIWVSAIPLKTTFLGFVGERANLTCKGNNYICKKSYYPRKMKNQKINLQNGRIIGVLRAGIIPHGGTWFILELSSTNLRSPPLMKRLTVCDPQIDN
ncbi:hypothetical protein GOBAR_DD10669 [Gossypium barbadense]|nr:hypothetical protein GOBAR_DD10669 [Gossypium barbadense]